MLPNTCPRTRTSATGCLEAAVDAGCSGDDPVGQVPVVDDVMREQ